MIGPMCTLVPATGVAHHCVRRLLDATRVCRAGIARDGRGSYSLVAHVFATHGLVADTHSAGDSEPALGIGCTYLAHSRCGRTLANAASAVIPRLALLSCRAPWARAAAIHVGLVAIPDTISTGRASWRCGRRCSRGQGRTWLLVLLGLFLLLFLGIYVGDARSCKPQCAEHT